MKFNLIFYTLISMTIQLSAQAELLDIYLIPGQGSDYRLFKNLELGDQFNIKYIHYTVPEKGASMADYAKELMQQVDTTRNYVLIGVSLGGMLTVEMSEIHPTYKSILISSAKCRNELPGRYRVQEKLLFYKIVSGKISKSAALILQPLVEPDRRKEKKTCISMLKAKDSDFMKRTIAMILEWHRVVYPDSIIHIHGNNDHTIPIRNVKYDYLIENGSHMMTLTKGNEISEVILQILECE